VHSTAAVSFYIQDILPADQSPG